MAYRRLVCLIAKGNKMKLYRIVVPYLMMGSAAIFSNNSANAQDIKTPDAPNPNTELQAPNELIAKNMSVVNTVSPYAITQSRLIARAENTCDM